MNVKNNKRRQESVERIRTAFFDLLKEKDISEIRVSQLCMKANINRSTFYASFVDIYDLADKTRLELEEEVTRILELEVTLGESKEDFLRLFTHIKENQELYRFYFKLGYDSRKLMLFDKCCVKAIDKDFLEYHLEFFKNGFNSIVKLWLENDCKESPEQMCNILLKEYRGRF